LLSPPYGGITDGDYYAPWNTTYSKLLCPLGYCIPKIAMPLGYCITKVAMPLRMLHNKDCYAFG